MRIVALYRLLLWLYPADLRRDYGDEMTAVFTELLSTQPTTGGRAAIVGRALGEVFTIALPGHLASERVIAASLSLVITSAVLGSLVTIMMYVGPHP
jgi:hypothetical protein